MQAKIAAATAQTSSLTDALHNAEEEKLRLAMEMEERCVLFTL
jgi:hypothetical protein